MSLQSDLIQAVVTLSTAAGSRVHDELVPQGVQLPFIAMTTLTAGRPLTLSAEGLLRRATVRIAIFSRNAQERDLIADALRAAYHGFRGMLGATILTSIRIEDSADSVELSDGDNVIKGKGLDLFAVFY